MLIFVNLNRLRVHKELVYSQLLQIRHCREALEQLLVQAQLDPALFGQVCWQKKELERLERAVSRRRQFLDNTEYRIWHLKENLREELDKAIAFVSPRFL